ncbi:prolyl oligopeptidase family serine peptidase [Variovorax sp. OV329]|uniref:prolyl oligopeptidase family serine peptidase n=1 Tax=Variovorax sp. OV329 TaxID=1882825 RepID=UPI0008E12FB3|nr:prolyl oligopeptidase family serine peptidase [Variovorax sp. OV329]SFL96305.1 Dipeptidyl aminopeptidase/acylaminoacyl peptidase [Variovorax sp. OV329]
MKTAPFGSWESPITPGLVAGSMVDLLDVQLDGGRLYWIEARPQEAGRHVLVCRQDDGRIADVLPADMNARTRVHEYGGGAVAVAGDTVCFSHFQDQRLYCQVADGKPDPLTPPGFRFADGRIDLARRLWIGVREDHMASDREAVNTIALLSLDAPGPGTVLVQGDDFYASPRLSPDGRHLAWLSWRHPHMPWVQTQLWVGDFDGNAVHDARQVAGGAGESVFQPEWSPDGVLHFVSDRSGWWNLHRLDANGAAVNVCPRPAEFGRAQWKLGMSTYAFLSAQEAVCAYIENGLGKLALLDLHSGVLKPYDLPYTDFASVRAQDGRVAFIGGTAVASSAVVLLDPRTGVATLVRQATGVTDDPAIARHLSAPQPIEFPTSNAQTAFALYYPPTNADFQAPEGELPPLLVRCHGGPTSSATRALDLRVQFWTSRGIAVVDVDYRGSAGYGRAYRERLHLAWGIVDVEDCGAAVRHLAERGLVDPGRTVISGGSAGGFTVLSCLTSTDEKLRQSFKAGGSHYGVSDVQALACDTHKFESRYLDWLIAPQDWAARSPVRHADRLSAPVTFFQGAEDRIVPPSQTEQMVAALREKNITAQYLLFAGEQHGFRQARNIRWALEAEFHFFDTLVFRLPPP